MSDQTKLLTLDEFVNREIALLHLKLMPGELEEQLTAWES